MRRPRRLLAACLTGLTLAAGAAVVAPAAPASAASAPVAYDFYRAPSPLPAGKPGQLIRYAAVTADLGATAPATAAWTVMYHSHDARSRDVAVTGTVLVPTAPWTGTGPRPVVTFTPGTQGLGPQCAPSKQIVAGSEYEDTSIALALQRGWAVVVTDYLGYTTGSTPSYTVGPDMAHAALDVVRAAAQVPGAGVDRSAPLATWGYSQGGGGSAWAAALQPGYAPELHLVADASGGVPADPKAVGDSLKGNVGAGFLLDAMIGNEATYGTAWPFTPALSDKGRADVATIKSQCVSDALTTFAFSDIDADFAPGTTYASFSALPSVQQVTAANQLAAQPAPRVPSYQYHAAADEVVPVAQAAALHRTWCAGGVTTRFDLVPGDHVAGDSAGADQAVAWIDDAFSGRPAAALGGCLL